MEEGRREKITDDVYIFISPLNILHLATLDKLYFVFAGFFWSLFEDINRKLCAQSKQ